MRVRVQRSNDAQCLQFACHILLNRVVRTRYCYVVKEPFGSLSLAYHMEEQADDTSVSTVATYEGLEMLAVTLNRICTTCVFGKQGRPNHVVESLHSLLLENIPAYHIMEKSSRLTSVPLTAVLEQFSTGIF